jgi:hypothetical protein
VRIGQDGLEFALVEKAVEAFGILAAEDDDRQSLRAILAPRDIAEHEPGAGVPDDEMDGFLRKFEVHRHRDQSRPHDAVVSREKLRAVGGQDGNTVAADEPAPGERAGDAGGHDIKLKVREFAQRFLTAQVDNGGLTEIAVADNQIAEVLEGGHGFVSTASPRRREA